MKMNERKKRFVQFLLLIFAIVQLVACGSDATLTAPAITSVDNATFTIGTAASFTVTATGSPTPTFALTGALPAGISFNSQTGVMSGTPAAGSSGTYLLAITASNGVAPNATQNFTLTVHTATTAILIVHDGSVFLADMVTNLSAIATTAGFTPTASVGIPAGSLTGYTQIWDIRYNNTTPLTAGDITTYTTYLASGGTLVAIGENTGFATRNDSIVSLISSLGGGSVTVTAPASDTQTVQAPFTGPNPVTTVTFLAAAGTATPGTGSFITKDASDIGAALVYSPGTLSGALSGRLLIVFDINFLQSTATADLQSLTANMIGVP